MPGASVGPTRAASWLLPAPQGPQPVLFPAGLVLQLLHLHSYSPTPATLASNLLCSLASPSSQLVLHLSNSCSPDAPPPLLLLLIKTPPASSSPQTLLIFSRKFLTSRLSSLFQLLLFLRSFLILLLFLPRFSVVGSFYMAPVTPIPETPVLASSPMPACGMA